MIFFKKEANRFSKDYEAGFLAGFRAKDKSLKDMWEMLEVAEITQESKHETLIKLIKDL